jgi:hypothetical protein
MQECHYTLIINVITGQQAEGRTMDHGVSLYLYIGMLYSLRYAWYCFVFFVVL